MYIAQFHHSLQSSQLTYIHIIPAQYPPKEGDQEYVFDVSMPFPVYIVYMLAWLTFV